jgi:hypothetical protein
MGIMRLLIERGAKMDWPDLHCRKWAVEHWQLEGVQLSLSYEAEVDAEDDEWTTRLSWLFYADERKVSHELHDYLVFRGAKKIMTPPGPCKHVILALYEGNFPCILYIDWKRADRRLLRYPFPEGWANTTEVPRYLTDIRLPGDNGLLKILCEHRDKGLR